MLSIKKIDEILKDENFIKLLENFYDVKITSDFMIRKDSTSFYKNGTFKTCDKKYIIFAKTNKYFQLQLFRRDIKNHYQNYTYNQKN